MDIPLIITTNADIAFGHFVKLGQQFERLQRSVQNQNKGFNTLNQTVEKVFKDTNKLNDAYKKNEITAKQYAKQFEVLNKTLSKNQVDLSDIIKRTEELKKGLENGTVSTAQAVAEFQKLSKACNEQTSKTDKLMSSFGKFRDSIGGVKGALAAMGIGVSFEKLAESAAHFGKTMLDLKQYARATGQGFAPLQAAIEDISKTTGLSQQHAAEYILTFQKGLKGPQLQADAIKSLAKTMQDAGISFDEMQESQRNLIAVENEAPGTIQKILAGYRDQTGIENYIENLASQGLVTRDSAEQLKTLANVMRDGKSAADDEPMARLAKSLNNLKESAQELYKVLGAKLAPFLAEVADKLKGVMEWVKNAPDWVIFGAAAVAAITAITAVVAPLVAAIATIGVGTIGVTAAFAAMAVPIAYAAKLIWDMHEAEEATLRTANALNEAKQRLGKNAVAGFEKEQEELERLKGANQGKAFSQAKADVIFAKEQELNRRMQEQFEKNLKGGKTGAGSGVVQVTTLKLDESSGPMAAATAAAAKAEGSLLATEQARKSTIDDINRKYYAQIKDLENIRNINDGLVEAQKIQAGFAIKYNDDVKGALKINASMKDTLEDQLKKERDIVAAAEARLALDPTSRQFRKDYNVALADTRKTEEKIRQIQMEQINVLEERKSVADANISAAEAELQLSQQLYMGIGPTIDGQKKVVDEYEKKIELVEQELDAARKLAAEHPKVLEFQKRVAELQGEKLQLASKELQITKNLREGYLDAMGAFTNVEGAFSKIILRREQGMGIMARQFGVVGGMKTGFTGEGGLSSPIARREAGTGRLTGSSPEAMEGLYRAAGLNVPLNRTRIGAAQAATAGGNMEAVLAGGSKVITGPAPKAGAEISIPGTGQGRELINTANQQMSTIEELNKNMPKYVSDGIKMSGGVGGVGSKGIGTAAATPAQNFARIQEEKHQRSVADQKKTIDKEIRSKEDLLKRQEIEGKKYLDQHPMGDKVDHGRRSGNDLIDTLGKKLASGKATGSEIEMLFKEMEKTSKNTLLISKSGDLTAKNSEKSVKILDKGIDQARMSNSVQNMSAMTTPLEALTDAADTMNSEDAGWVPFAAGGKIPGAGDTDSVPAMLTPGERVMRKEVSKKFGPFLDSLNKNHYAFGGVVGPSPSFGGISGGGMPNISISARGDTVNKIMQSVNQQLSTQLNRMLTPNGTTGRQFEMSAG